MIIDAKDLILGRMASFAAKQALLGENIDIINVEKAVITGKKDVILKKYLERRRKGDVFKGPFYPRDPEKFVKRTIRGMLPYKNPRGRDALKRIKCYEGIPENLKEKAITIKEVSIENLKNPKFITIERLTKLLGR